MQVGSEGRGPAISAEDEAYVHFCALRTGCRENWLPCSDGGARMINRDPDITRRVDRLEKRG
jgi:hypothetical protein